MSNDTRFWLVRISLFVVIAVDLFFMGKMQQEAQDPHSTHLVLWAVIFFVAVLLTIPVGLMAYVAKRQRWDTVKPIDRIEVETLAATAKQEQPVKKPPVVKNNN